MARVLILYYSRSGATQQLADAIAEGVASAGGEAVLRTVNTASDAASERDLDAIDRDLADGKISAVAAEHDYEVVVDRETGLVERDATAQRQKN